MNSEYILDIGHIRKINEMCGGGLRNDAEIETALMLGKGKVVYKKIAYLWKAILVGHPFTDGNKRTALVVAIKIFENCDIYLNENKKENLVEEIKKIAKENITDIIRIERLIRYVVTKD